MMNNYPSTRVKPYVYMGHNPVTGEFYIGYREANTKPSHIDLFDYRTSSNRVRPIKGPQQILRCPHCGKDGGQV